MQVEEFSEGFIEQTGTATFHLNRMTFPPISQAVVDGQELLDAKSTGMRLSDSKGRVKVPRIERVECEVSGPVRATFRYEGVFTKRFPCRFVARVCFFAGSGLVRMRFTLHNPRRAKHPGGLWDLGDPGSMLLQGLSLNVGLRGNNEPVISWITRAGQQPQNQEGGKLEIYQDSSGGKNWDSNNHLNRNGEVPCSLRGYRMRSQSCEEFGERASPIVSLQNAQGCLSAAIPEFWQQFPKAIEANGGTLRLGLFPHQCTDLFELQG